MTADDLTAQISDLLCRDDCVRRARDVWAMDLASQRLCFASAAAVIAKRFRIPLRVVAEVALTPAAELVARYEEQWRYPPNQIAAVVSREEFPMYSTAIPPFGHIEERYLMYLRTFDPAGLINVEATEQIKSHQTYETYVRWTKNGSVPPYIWVNESPNGELISTSRRRTLVAQELGRTIEGWLSPHNTETDLPLKFGDVASAFSLELKKILSLQAILPPIPKKTGLSLS